jgi:hypothetical protein
MSNATKLEILTVALSVVALAILPSQVNSALAQSTTSTGAANSILISSSGKN